VAVLTAVLAGLVAIVTLAVSLAAARRDRRRNLYSEAYRATMSWLIECGRPAEAADIALALRYFYVSAEWKRSVEMEALARIRALQARIRPHFLFNSMNTIAALTRSAPERAEQAVEDLADLFRASLSDANARIALKDEIEIARTHERIEQLRLRERLRVQWDVDGLPMRVEVPSLILQPLLENAVYHGIEMLPGGGAVSIVGRRVGDMLHIEVRNPIPPQLDYSEREGNRMALENIRQRLELAWPGRARVEIEQLPGEFCARLIFPADEVHSLSQ